jgi:hypothetical protein
MTMQIHEMKTKSVRILPYVGILLLGLSLFGCQEEFYKSQFGNYLPKKPHYRLCETGFEKSYTEIIDTARIYQTVSVRFNDESKTNDTTYSYVRFYSDGTSFSKWQIGKPSIAEYEETRDGFPGCWRINEGKLFTETYNHHFNGTYFLSEYVIIGDTLKCRRVKSGKYGTWVDSDKVYVKAYDIVLKANRLEERASWNVRNK